MPNLQVRPFDLWRDRVRRARESPRVIPAGAMRYFRGARVQPGRVVVGPHSTVRGKGVWRIDGKLTVGVTGMPFNMKGDRTAVLNDGTFHAVGHVLIHRGARLVVDEGAVLEIGNGTFVNAFTIVYATRSIRIGADCAISWRCEIYDSQYHDLRYEGRRPDRRSVVIGDHVWIGAGVRILDGTALGDGCVVAAGSIVSGTFPARTLIGGAPARVLREDVDWAL